MAFSSHLKIHDRVRCARTTRRKGRMRRKSVRHLPPLKEVLSGDASLAPSALSFACATRLACSPLPLCRLTLSLEISLLPRNHIPFLPCLSPLLDLYPSPSLFLISPNHPTDGCAMSDLRPPLRPFTTSSAESTTSSRGTGVGVSRRRHCLSIHPWSLFPVARLLLPSSEWTGVTICTLAVCPDAIA